MRARSYLTADEWAARLDECMAMVLAQPENFDPCVQWWARWRRDWLAECVNIDTPPATTGSRCTPLEACAQQVGLFVDQQDTGCPKDFWPAAAAGRPIARAR